MIAGAALGSLMATFVGEARVIALGACLTTVVALYAAIFIPREGEGVPPATQRNVFRDIGRVIGNLSQRTAQAIVFTVAPRTTLLMAMWHAGKLFPRSDRSPTMIPHDAARLAKHCPGTVTKIGRITSGFYISEALEHRT